MTRCLAWISSTEYSHATASVLSPFLISVVLHGIADSTRAVCQGVSLNTDRYVPNAPRVARLLHADDRVILSEDAGQLQKFKFVLHAIIYGAHGLDLWQVARLDQKFRRSRLLH